MITLRVHNTGGVTIIQGASHLSSSSCRQNQNHLNLYENINQRKKQESSRNLIINLQDFFYNKRLIIFLLQKNKVTTGWERLIRSHSSARFCFELSGNSN